MRPMDTRRQRLRRHLITLMARLPWRPSHQSRWPPERLLVIRPDDLGDLLLATPALARLRAALPDTHLTVAVGPWALETLRHGPDHDAELVIAFPGVSRARRTTLIAPYRLLLAEARRLRTHRFDAALILRPDHWWGALLARMAGIPVRVGFGLPDVAPSCTDTLPLPAGHHAAALSLALVDRYLGRPGSLDPTAAPLTFRPQAAEIKRAEALLQPIGAGVRHRLAIHPGGGRAIKQWSTAGWLAVARQLMTEGQVQLIVTGIAAEAHLTAPLVAGLARGSVLDLTGQTDLGTLGAIFARCDLVLGVDSGALHIATACAPRTLRLYGPSDPVEYGPWGEAAYHRALHAGLTCPLCHNLDREIDCQPRCMAAIPATEVVAEARRLLALSVPPVVGD